MTIENFIEVCNDFFEGKLLVLKKSILPNAHYKAYKTFKYEVWLVQGSLKEIIVETELMQEAVKESQYKNAESACEAEVCKKLIKYIKDL